METFTSFSNDYLKLENVKVEFETISEKKLKVNLMLNSLKVQELDLLCKKNIKIEQWIFDELIKE